MTDSKPPRTEEARDFAFYVGIDWASAKHDLCVVDAGGRLVQQQSLEHGTGTIDDWVGELVRRADGRPVAIILEQTRGALIYALMNRENVCLFPINPQQFAAYRKSFNNVNAKDDKVEARLLARFLFERHRDLRRWEPADEPTRLLGQLAEARRAAVDDRTRFCVQLRDLLTKYYPQLLTLAATQLHECGALLAIVCKWSDPKELSRARRCDIVRVLREHGAGKSNVETLAEQLRTAPLHCRDKVIARVCAMRAHALAKHVQLANRTVAEYDEALKEAVAKHPDYHLFAGVKGLGKALLPRVIAAFGSDRDRFGDAQEVANFSGTSPVCRQSGKMRVVVRRRACNQHLKQTFHELANATSKWTRWAKAYYRYQRDRGLKHHAALRKLARCWIRILYRVWKDRVAYDDARYEQALLLKTPGLAKYLPAA